MNEKCGRGSGRGRGGLGRGGGRILVNLVYAISSYGLGNIYFISE